MAYDDLRRYAHEILVPLVTTMSGFSKDAEVVKRMVEYAYPDKALPGETNDLVIEIVKVGRKDRQIGVSFLSILDLLFFYFYFLVLRV